MEQEELGKGFGSNQVNRTTKRVGEDGLNMSADLIRGYMEINLGDLPTKGRFYSNDTKVLIRAARTEEIKEYSLMDETNPMEVNDKVNSIISACTSVRSFTDRTMTYRDLVEDDKMFLALSIREYTFPRGESQLKLKPMCPHCGNSNEFDFKTDTLDYYEEDSTLAKYYSPVNKIYSINTKTHGVIELNPPKIGVMQKLSDYVRAKQSKREKWNKADIQILPYILSDYRYLNEKTIYEKIVDMQGWSPDRYSLVFSLIEKMKNSIKSTLTRTCEHCGREFNVKVEIEGGMKGLFVDMNSDKTLENELI